MSEIDLATRQDPQASLSAGTINTDTDTTGSAVDRQGYEAATLIGEVSSYNDGTYVFTLQHDDDDGSGSPSGSWADVPADQLIGDEPSLGAAGTAKLGYAGGKRHLRAKVTSTSTSTGATVAAMIVLGTPRVMGSGPADSI